MHPPAQITVIQCPKSWSPGAEGDGEEDRHGHVLSGIHKVRLSLTQLILNFRGKRQRLPRDFGWKLVVVWSF